jgi:hypothetical protein
MTRISGGKSTNFTAFVVYLFCQSVQIIVGHLLIEDYYDWNIFQVRFPAKVSFIEDSYLKKCLTLIMSLAFLAFHYSAGNNCHEYHQNYQRLSVMD